MEDFFSVILVFVLLVGLVALGVLTFADLRHFDTVVQQCEKQGYIQNDTKRIFCSVEKRPVQ